MGEAEVSVLSPAGMGREPKTPVSAATSAKGGARGLGASPRSLGYAARHGAGVGHASREGSPGTPGGGEGTPPGSASRGATWGKRLMDTISVGSPFRAWTLGDDDDKDNDGNDSGGEEGGGGYARRGAGAAAASEPLSSASKGAPARGPWAGADVGEGGAPPAPSLGYAQSYLLTTNTAKLRAAKAQQKLHEMEMAAAERRADAEYAPGDELPESHKKLAVKGGARSAGPGAGTKGQTPARRAEGTGPRAAGRAPIGGDMLMELLEETSRLRGLMEVMESKMAGMAGEGERSRAKIARLREERDALRASLDGAAEAEGDSVHLANELLEARRSIAHLEAERDAMELDCADLVAEVRRLMAVAHEAEVDLSDSETARARLELMLEERTSEADALRGELRELRLGHSAKESPDSPAGRKGAKGSAGRHSAEVSETLARRAVEGKIAELLKEQRLVRRRASAMNDRLQ